MQLWCLLLAFGAFAISNASPVPDQQESSIQNKCLGGYCPYPPGYHQPPHYPPPTQRPNQPTRKPTNRPRPIRTTTQRWTIWDIA